MVATSCFLFLRSIQHTSNSNNLSPLVLPPADKDIPNSSKVAVEVTPPMNGVAGGDDVRLQFLFFRPFV